MLHLESILKPYLSTGTVFGLVGVGNFGSRIRDIVSNAGLETLLCDPPKSLDDADLLNDALHIEWGNGMGGCNFSDVRTDTYLPLASLARANVISVQVPLSEETRGMITADFLAKCGDGTKILCFSPAEVLEKSIRADRRIVLFEDEIC